MQRLFLTFFGVGLIPFAPGTFGSIAGAIFAWGILQIASATTLFLASILLFLVGVSVVNDYEKRTGTHDLSSIVIDEVAGVWLAIAMCGENLWQLGLSLAFFRLFDIAKPSIIGRVDKQVGGGLGVMGDDMLAGFFAGLASLICYFGYFKFVG